MANSLRTQRRNAVDIDQPFDAVASFNTSADRLKHLSLHAAALGVTRSLFLHSLAAEALSARGIPFPPSERNEPRPGIGTKRQAEGTRFASASPS